MKNQVICCLSIFISLAFGRIIAQSTGSGQFVVADRFGNKYNIENLYAGSVSTVQSIIGSTCSSGYFIASFEQGSIWDVNSAAQAVLCQVLKDISNFIISPLSTNINVGPKIRLYCGNTPTASPGTLGAASAYYVFPVSSTNPNQGLIDNQIYKMIVSGVDSYSNVPSSFVNGSFFYHGYVYGNPNPPGGGSWNTTMTSTTVANTEFCMYSIFLHEICHALGFASLIDANGTSILNPLSNSYSRYDKFLKDASGNSLLGAQSNACPTSSLTFTASVLSVNPFSCTSTGTPADVTTCSTAVKYVGNTYTATVYTPNCYENGSSLSHFEDMCPISNTANCVTSLNSIANNNKYYVMSNGQGMGSCYVKRYLRDAERSVLCDIGYSLTGVYGSTVAGSNYTYASGACYPTNVWGMNDGMVNGFCTYSASASATNAIPIPISAVLANDSPNTTTLSCLEVIQDGSFITASISGTNIIVFNSINAPGVVILKYLPGDGAGNYGGATYIYAYFYSSSCPSPNTCSLVQNGGFESSSGSPLCGFMTTTNTLRPDCWWPQFNAPEYFLRNCNAGGNIFNVGSNVLGLTPTIDSFNGSPNNAFVGIYNSAGTFSPGYGYAPSWINSDLSSPLIPAQVYQVSLWVINPFSVSGTSVTANPEIIRISTAPNSAFIPDPLPFASFTVNNTGNLWTYLTNTFVFTQPTGHSTIKVLIDPLSVLLPNTAMAGLIQYYAFVDEISIVPASGTTLSIPNPTISCGTLTNLAQYASPSGGVFSGPGVTALTTSAGTQYNFNTSGLAYGASYPIAFTYSTAGGCSNTLWQNIPVSQGINPGICDNGYTLTAAGFTSGNSFTWMPGGVTTQTFAVYPTGTTTYTLFAYNGTCVATHYVTLKPCCSLSGPPSFTSTVLSNSLTGSVTFTNNLTVAPGTSMFFVGGDFLFAPGTNITVKAGAALIIKDSHLRACTNVMWQGIVVEDGGNLTFSYENKDNLIEDAVIAADINAQNTSNLNNIFSATHTTFNKNRVDINISGYQRNSSNYPFSISGCVFTCRDFSFTPTSWPQASIAIGGLRYATGTSTTGLSAPYSMQSATVANLKYPFPSITSQTAIALNNVGLTLNTYTYCGIKIGDFNGAQLFNLFDNHKEGISSINSNLKIYNNVFQNMRYGIRNNITNVMNAKLDMLCGSFDVGNRFWDCYCGVDGNNLYQFYIEKSIFRSTQSTISDNVFDITNCQGGGVITQGGPPPLYNWPAGTFGIYLNTNRFNYVIRNSEFTNINNGFGIGIYGSTYTVATNTIQNGIYGCLTVVQQNTFSALSPNATSTLIGTNYMNQAISITSPNSFPWAVAIPNNMFVYDRGFFIENNSFRQVYNAININGFYSITRGFRTRIDGNAIKLADDARPCTFVQRGISVTNSLGRTSVDSNAITGTGISNNKVTLVHNGINTGVVSPSVTCNLLYSGFNGFEFVGYNNSAVWRGNSMERLSKGLFLNSAGVIGQQGSNTQSASNYWNDPVGGWWSGTNYGTFVFNSSASLSPMWIKPGASTPLNNWGQNVTPSQIFGSNSLSVATFGDFNCAMTPNAIVLPVPITNVNDFNTYAHYYISSTALYRYLQADDSVRNSASKYAAFVDAFSGSSVDIFYQVEKKIYNRDFALAKSLNSSVSATNNVEYNYKQFYNIWISYATNGFLSSTEGALLFGLTQLCPGTDGACVYQARALYDKLSAYPQRYLDNCESNGMRVSQIKKDTANDAWKLDIFPNPTANTFNMESNLDNELLKVEIKDLSGRSILEQMVKTKDYIATLDLSLMNGAYLIIVTNSRNESIVKKLLVAK